MSAIDEVVKSFDQSDSLAQAQKEAVLALAAIGASKAEMFVMQIIDSLTSAGYGSNPTVPVSTVRQKISDVRAYSASEAGNIAPIVSKTLRTFLEGTPERIVTGLSTLISDTLGVFLGSNGANSDTIDQYYIATEGMAIIRVDLKAWYQNVTTSSIRTRMERVTAAVAIKSAVDVTKTDLNTLMTLYQRQLFAFKMDSQMQQEAQKELHNIYTELRRSHGLR